MSDSGDQIQELDLGVTPEAAVSGAVCVQTEAGTFLTFNAMRATDRPSPYGGFFTEDAGTAVVEFKRCRVSRFGSPYDEARCGVPQYKAASYGIYEVLGSSWIKEVVRLNRYSFPKTTDGYVKRHFLFTFHDDTFECLADDLTLEVFDEPYAVTFERVRRRALGEGAG
jgi:hypothetical protein